MNPRAPKHCAVLLLIALAAAIGGCGGDEGPGPGAYGLETKDEGRTTAEHSEKPKPAPPLRAEVWRADSADVKRALFELDGFALYRFDKDEGAQSTCYGACAKKWPPLLTEAKPKGVAVKQSELGTTKRKDGSIQVTYFGHPLYTFTGDKITGDVDGRGVEAFGGTWYALQASGRSVAD